ncbi:MAG: S24 family peptidase [Pseudomonadota bacterium]
MPDTDHRAALKEIRTFPSLVRYLRDEMGWPIDREDFEELTIRIMQEINEVIEQHGGWPGAFQTGEAKAATPKVIPFRPRVVQPRPEERYATCVPLVPLKAAAGAFSDPQHVEDDGFEWVAVECRHRLRPGMFVAQVVGKSMEPAIPDGSYCLFTAPVAGTRHGKTVLVQLRDATDPKSGERYTVKRYESEKAQDGDLWHHTTITLKPVNPDFEPIVLTGAEEGRLQVIAECVEVLAHE